MANLNLSALRRMLPINPMAEPGLMIRLRAERELAELLDDDSSDTRIFIEHAGARWFVAVERRGRTVTAVGETFVAAWRSLADMEQRDA